MTRRLGASLPGILLLAGCAAAASGPGQPGGLVAEGKAFAREACAACHQVAADQPPPPPVFDSIENEHVAAPSFMAIARDPAMDAEALRRAIRTPAHPMKEQLVADDRLEALIAYIRSL